MPKEGTRFMRLIVFFDLPVKTPEERREANKFRRFLIADGYTRVQLSVYSRVCRGQETVEKHLMRLRGHLPPEGCVRSLQVTEQQYNRIQIHVGTMAKQERLAPQQLSFF